MPPRGFELMTSSSDIILITRNTKNITIYINNPTQTGSRSNSKPNRQLEQTEQIGGGNEHAS